MKSTAQFLDTDKLDLSLTITMPLRDWKELREALKQTTQWPTSDLRYAITNAVTLAEGRIEVPCEREE